MVFINYQTYLNQQFPSKTKSFIMSFLIFMIQDVGTTTVNEKQQTHDAYADTKPIQISATLSSKITNQKWIHSKRIPKIKRE